MLSPGTRLGAYDITALIGHGGMGEVYRARDTKLHRDVAIKILPPGFATDPERLARFDREARTLASLNHPNIAQIHGIEDVGSTRAIVMELVDGEDLSRRIARSPLPQAQALAMARQIADAMQTAHDHGVVHRDLKPANVIVKNDGTIKIVDFGLARGSDPQAADTAASQAPTVMMSLPGTLLGTAAYMSPEQIRGETADARSDVWAFGCLLFEMLTGRAAFSAPTTAEILAGVLTKEPEWRHLPADTPEPVRRVLRRCLDKTERNRMRAIADARLEIDDALKPGQPPAHSGRAIRSRTIALAVAATAALLALAVLATLRFGRQQPAPGEIRFDITTPDTDAFLLSSVALSPDGRQILFVADSDGQPHIWLRPIDSVTARPLAGTGGAAFPFWSPTGRSLAFFADGFLKRLDLDGGLVRRLAKTTVGIGGTWNRDGVILFVRNPASAIARVSEDGGPTGEATRLEPGHIGHTFPHFLPDGRHFLYRVTAASDEARGIYVGQLDGTTSRRLVNADAGGVFTNNHILFVRQSKVFAHGFDTDQLELTGSPFEVADGVFGRLESFTLSAAAGAFAFRAGAAPSRQFAWVDRSGTLIARVGGRLRNPDGISYSPDRSQLVYFERGAASSDLWVLDTRRGLVNRFTDEADEDIFPHWAREPERIVYTSVRNGQIAVYEKDFAIGRKELLLPAAVETFVSDIAPAGRQLIYQRMDPKTGWDVWTAPAGRAGEATPVLHTDADERSARLSPDSRWLAFVSNTSGTFEVYVQPFPGPGRRSQVSTKGGDQPQWRADGKELYYVALDGKLTATSVTYAQDRQSIEVGAPIPLFATQAGSAAIAVITSNYAASADGQRFLVNQVVQDAGPTPLRVVLHWSAAR